ncbi:hypothetical protein PN836_014965 [Ningiella sp. W23]|uniref:hypothetical protein n=1 Tax=Ningiella sp. W23 TaxID=3023715 RepID=UPI0037567F45
MTSLQRHHLLALCLLHFSLPVFASNMENNMNISIQVAMSSAVDPVDCVDEMNVYRFGTQLRLAASFTNEGSEVISIDNPQTSQQSLLLLKRLEEQEEETVFELNPASIDVTGEITAPESFSVEMQTQQSIDFDINISERFEQSTFLPGTYEVAVQYLDYQSNTLKYVVRYNETAKKKLLNIAIDEGADIEIRSLAADFLMSQSDTNEIEILLPERDESAEQRDERVKRNELAVKQLLEP